MGGGRFLLLRCLSPCFLLLGGPKGDCRGGGGRRPRLLRYGGGRGLLTLGTLQLEMALHTRLTSALLRISSWMFLLMSEKKNRKKTKLVFGGNYVRDSEFFLSPISL